jgi:hypothetical protein
MAAGRTPAAVSGWRMPLTMQRMLRRHGLMLRRDDRSLIEHDLLES